MISFLISLVVFLVVTNAISIFYLYRFSITILNIESEIENSLDQLEESYQSISKVLEIDVFFDSVEVRKVINEIKNSKIAVHSAANNLSKNFRMINEVKEEEKEND